MIVIDASCLFETVAARAGAKVIESALAEDPDHAAPHIIDVEVLGIIRKTWLLGQLDGSAAAHAVAELGAWGGERFSHRTFLERAWELRDNVRGWDAMYVALAEATESVLFTTDARLANATGPRCAFRVFSVD